MRTVIYADVLVVVNLVVNYCLLRACAALTGGRAKPWRLLLACALGGAYALIIFLDGIPVWLNAMLLTLFAVLMVLVAFGFGGGKRFLKQTAAFLLADCFFAGAMLAVCVLFSPQPLVWRNGVVYLDLDLLTLALLSVGCYLLLSLLARLTGSGAPQSVVFQAEIRVGGQTVSGRALLDTGNTLRDGFSARPVVIAQRSLVQPLLPADGDLTAMQGFRLVPYSTVGQEGVLPAFRADAVTVRARGRQYQTAEAVVAVTERALIAGGYHALFGPAFLEQAHSATAGGRLRSRADFERNGRHTE